MSRTVSNPNWIRAEGSASQFTFKHPWKSAHSVRGKCSVGLVWLIVWWGLIIHSSSSFNWDLTIETNNIRSLFNPSSVLVQLKALPPENEDFPQPCLCRDQCLCISVRRGGSNCSSVAQMSKIRSTDLFHVQIKGHVLTKKGFSRCYWRPVD